MEGGRELYLLQSPRIFIEPSSAQAYQAPPHPTLSTGPREPEGPLRAPRPMSTTCHCDLLIVSWLVYRGWRRFPHQVVTKEDQGRHTSGFSSCVTINIP